MTEILKFQKPFVSAVNIKKRLIWAKEHLHWTVEQWRTVFWTDESPFVLQYNGRKRVWRMWNERYDPRCIQGTVKHDKKVMVWGGFAAHGVGKLVWIDGIMDKDVYHKVLQHHAFPSAETLFPDKNYIFQQDNDPKHTAIINKRYLVNKKIKTFDWPPQSPDLNPIENLWSILDGRLKDRKPQSEQELFDMLGDAWYELPVDLLTKLADSMPRRCQAVIKNKGYPTKY